MGPRDEAATATDSGADNSSYFRMVRARMAARKTRQTRQRATDEAASG